MAQSGSSFAQEIHDEFLVCKICFQQFRKPKCLSCMHTFCEKCIETQFRSYSKNKVYTDYRDFICPLCRKSTKVPAGGVSKLPDNFTVSSLLGVVGHQYPQTGRGQKKHMVSSCDFCKLSGGCRYREATAKCIDCSKLLCADCVQVHRGTKVTSDHSLFGIDVEKDVQCKEHPEEVVRFYCVSCDACICILCTFNQHLNHHMTQFPEAVAHCKAHVETVLASCQGKITEYNRRVEAITKLEELMATARQKIKDAASQYVQDIRNGEKKLLAELKQALGTEVTSQLERKKDLLVTLDGMRSAVDICDLIIGGKDLELLLLKKDVEEKLTTVNSIPTKDLPQRSLNDIQFSPGAVSLGHLYDRDVPLLGASKTKRSGRESGSVDGLNCTSGRHGRSSTREFGVQTESYEDPNDRPPGKSSSKAQKSTMTEGLPKDGPTSSRGGSVAAAASLPIISVRIRASPPKETIDEQEQRRRKRIRELDQVATSKPGSAFKRI